MGDLPRTYAAADEGQILRELQAHLPAELAGRRDGRRRAAPRARAGRERRRQDVADQHSAAGRAAALDGEEEDGGRNGVYWPTIGTRRLSSSVQPPGLPELPLEVWDTSGQERFKPLSLSFYDQAHSLLRVFDVKSRASFRAIGENGGSLREFEMPGRAPRV